MWPTEQSARPERNTQFRFMGPAGGVTMVHWGYEMAEIIIDNARSKRHRKIMENLRIRKWYEYSEEVHYSEMGVAVDGEPVRKFVVAAAVTNPFAGAFGEDLSASILPSETLGAQIAERLVAAANGHEIQSYGKACIVGTAGEYEHGNAMLTSLFADPIREAIGGGKSWVPSTGKRGGPGASIDVPLAHKDALYVRSHYDTVTVTFGDAPSPDEVLVIFAVATRGRPNARVGGLAASEIKGLDGLT